MLDVITACAILHNILRKQANEDLEALGAMVNNGGVEDDDDDAYLDTEIYNICDDGGTQSRVTNDGDKLWHSLAS
jgi:hypothetical protein